MSTKMKMNCQISNINAAQFAQPLQSLTTPLLVTIGVSMEEIEHRCIRHMECLKHGYSGFLQVRSLFMNQTTVH